MKKDYCKMKKIPGTSRVIFTPISFVFLLRSSWCIMAADWYFSGSLCIVPHHFCLWIPKKLNGIQSRCQWIDLTRQKVYKNSLTFSFLFLITYFQEKVFKWEFVQTIRSCRKQPNLNPLSARWPVNLTRKQTLYTLSESETTSNSNWDVIRDGEPDEIFL